MYSQLVNKDTPLCDRLKLLRYSWYHGHVQIPNKHQVLLDVVSGIVAVLDSLNEKEKEAVWVTLFTLIDDIAQGHEVNRADRGHESSDSKVTLSLKLSKVLLSDLATHVVRMESAVSDVGVSTELQSLVSCWNNLLSSPSLSHLFLTNTQNLTSLMSVVCQLTYSMHRHNHPTATVEELLGRVVVRYRAEVRQSPNPKSLLPIVTSKLLVVMVIAREVLVTARPITSSNITDFLLETLMPKAQTSHEENIHSEAYVGTQSLKYIVNALHKPSSTQELLVDPAGDLLHSAIHNFLPLIFSQFLHSNSGTKFMEFKTLWSTMTEKGDDCCVLNENQSQKLLSHLLASVSAQGIYNIHEPKELEFLILLRDELLKQRVTSDWLECMCELLHLNHKILEEKIGEILRQSWVKCLTSPSTNYRCLLSESLTTYARLRQIPVYFTTLIATVDDLKLPQETHSSIIPSKFLKTLAVTCEGLPRANVLFVWRLFIDATKTVINSDQNEMKQKTVLALFTHFLLNIRVSYATIAVKNDKQFSDLLSRTSDDILVPLTTTLLANTETSQSDLASVLGMCYSWGELGVLMHQYGHMTQLEHSLTPTATPATDLSPVHPYCAPTAWHRLLTSADNHYLPDLLKIQKLRVLLLFSDQPDQTSIKNIVESVLSDEILKQWACRAPGGLWDGAIFSVNSDTDGIARCHTVTSLLPVLLPLFTPDQLDSLTEFIFIHSVHDGGHLSQDHHTISTLCSSVLTDPACHELPAFTAAMWNVVVLHMTTALGCVPIPSPKKRRSSSGHALSSGTLDIFKSLAHLLHPEAVMEPDNESPAAINQTVAKLLKSSQGVVISPEWNDLLASVQVLLKLPLEHMSLHLQNCIAAFSFASLILTMQSHDPRGNPDAVRIVEALESTLIRTGIGPGNKGGGLWANVGGPKVFELLAVLEWLRDYCAWSECKLETPHDPSVFLDQVLKVCLRQQQSLEPISGFINKLSTSMADSRKVSSDLTLIAVLLKNLGLVMKKGDAAIPRFLETIASSFFFFLKHRAPTQGTGGDDTTVRIFKSLVLRRGVLPALARHIHKYLVRFYRQAARSMAQDVGSGEADISGVVQYMSATRLYLLCAAPDDPHSPKFTADDIRETWSIMMNLIGRFGHRSISGSKIDALKSVENVGVDAGADVKSLSFRNVMHKNSIERAKYLLVSTEESLYGKVDIETTTTHSNETSNAGTTIATLSTDCEQLIGQTKLLLPPLMAASTSGLFTEVLKEIARALGGGLSSTDGCTLRSAVVMVRLLVETVSAPELSRLLNAHLHQCHIYAAMESIRDCLNKFAQVLISLNALLVEICRQRNSGALWEIVVEILTTQNAVVASDVVTLTGSNFAPFLSCHHILSPTDAPGLHAFTATFTLLTDRLILMMKRYHTLVITNMAPIFSLCKQLQMAMIERGTQNTTSLSTQNEAPLLLCATELAKLLSLLAKSKEVGELIVFLVSNHLIAMHKNTVYPSIKRILERGVFSLLDVCDERTMRFMHAALPAGAQDVFTDLHADYSKFHKFTGKV